MRIEKGVSKKMRSMKSNDHVKTLIISTMISVSTLIIGTIVVYANISISKPDLFFSKIVTNKFENNTNMSSKSKLKYNFDFNSNDLS